MYNKWSGQDRGRAFHALHLVRLAGSCSRPRAAAAAPPGRGNPHAACRGPRRPTRGPWCRKARNRRAGVLGGRYPQKIDDDPVKASDPGRLQVRRFDRRDVIYDVDLRGPVDGEDLLVEVVREGELVYDAPDAGAVRALSSRRQEWFAAAARRRCK